MQGLFANTFLAFSKDMFVLLCSDGRMQSSTGIKALLTSSQSQQDTAAAPLSLKSITGNVPSLNQRTEEDALRLVLEAYHEAEGAGTERELRSPTGSWASAAQSLDAESDTEDVSSSAVLDAEWFQGRAWRDQQEGAMLCEGRDVASLILRYAGARFCRGVGGARDALLHDLLQSINGPPLDRRPVVMLVGDHGSGRTSLLCEATRRLVEEQRQYATFVCWVQGGPLGFDELCDILEEKGGIRGSRGSGAEGARLVCALKGVLREGYSLLIAIDGFSVSHQILAAQAVIAAHR